MCVDEIQKEWSAMKRAIVMLGHVEYQIEERNSVFPLPSSFSSRVVF